MMSGFELKEVVPWGRSFEEYCLMFSLTEDDLNSRILGCADGPASFNAQLTQRGGTVVSTDPLYQFTQDEIRSRIEAVRPVMLEKTKAMQEGFIWDYYKTPENLGKIRMAAMNDFLQDYNRGKIEGRYVEASLPKLPFEDDSFDLAVVSHFLFLYSEHHDLEFHLASIRELMRVAREVRIFPLLALGNSLSPHLKNVLDSAEISSIMEIVVVNYEFQRGGNQLLKIT